MKYGRVLLPLGIALLTGCQKIATESASDLLASASAACESSDDTSLGSKIVGDAEVQSGSVSSYALKNSGHCVDGNKVNWKAAGSSATKTSAAGLSSVFKRSGTYVVTAQEKATSASSEVVSFKTTVVSEEIAIAGPQAAFAYNPVTVSVVIPASMAAQSIEWDFGDGSAKIQNQHTVEHAFMEQGEFNVKVVVLDSEGQSHNLSHRISVIPYMDGSECIADLAISGATEAKVKVATSMSVFIPDCLAGRIGAVRWDFGDGNSGANQTVSHAYQAVGTYNVTAKLFLGSSQTSFVTLDHKIRVIEDLPVDPEPEDPVDPNACLIKDEVRESSGELYSEVVACGLDGSKTVTYKDAIKEQCQVVGEKLLWIEISRDKQITNEGECQGQSCRLPDGSVLTNGASKVLYTEATPVGSCSSVSETRTCNNGVLSGSSAANQLVCHNGCGNFGSHGTVKTGVVTGEIKVPLVCAYGEQGFFDTFTQISDQTCNDGTVVSSNDRQGTLTVAGSCPVYSHVATENFTACDANCGGKQQRIFVCKDDKGQQVDAIRCSAQAAPVEERLCDANPDAVRSQSSVTTTEDANSSNLCPKNQIGVILKSRDIVTTTTMACINHQVQVESVVSVPGAWVEESYCRDYVARRCSQDSLSNSEAKGRYEWMKKCQDQLPIIKEFLTNFDDVAISFGGRIITLGMSTGSQQLYPTFMNYATQPEKPWIAPKSKSAACAMPETVYVATICVSSCATPEQQILAQDATSGKLKYVSFIDALTSNTPYVASLKNADSMQSKAVVNRKVDQWVTELIDTEHDILVFKMKSGRELRVTPNHPVLAADGSMKEASAFKSGEALVELGGKLDPIVSISATKHFGKVYNLFVQSSEPAKNIVVTNGYLNGTAYFQNAGTKDMNRSLFKQKMIRGVFQ